MTKPAWGQHAACLDLDTELFFPVGTTGKALEQMEEARPCAFTVPSSMSAWNGRWTHTKTPASGAARPKTSAAPSAATGSGDARQDKAREDKKQAFSRWNEA
jgi:hypothetical protein